jgi:hypothetical protein
MIYVLVGAILFSVVLDMDGHDGWDFVTGVLHAACRRQICCTSHGVACDRSLVLRGNHAPDDRPRRLRAEGKWGSPDGPCWQVGKPGNNGAQGPNKHALEMVTMSYTFLGTILHFHATACRAVTLNVRWP